jgi:hypothetical protein
MKVVHERIHVKGDTAIVIDTGAWLTSSIEKNQRFRSAAIKVQESCRYLTCFMIGEHLPGRQVR